MANTPVVVMDDTMTSIASAIRGKNGSSDTYKPSEMANAIENIAGASITVRPTSYNIGRNTPAGAVVLTDVLVDLNKITSAQNMFAGTATTTSLVLNFDTSRITNASRMCAEDRALTHFETKYAFHPTDLENAFRNTGFTVTPEIDTSLATTTVAMFYDQYSGQHDRQVRCVYDLSSITNNNYGNMFGGLGVYDSHQIDQLTVDYLLQTCLTGTQLTIKTLAKLLQYVPTYIADLAQASSYYQDFLDAGWTIS